MKGQYLQDAKVFILEKVINYICTTIVLFEHLKCIDCIFLCDIKPLTVSVDSFIFFSTNFFGLRKTCILEDIKFHSCGKF